MFGQMSENIQIYFKTMKEVHNNILDFIENEEDMEEKYQNLFNFFNDEKISDDYDLFKSTLCILKNLLNHHHRNHNFFPKIKKILLNLKDSIKQTFSNYDIFNIFKSNKLILLFLFENGFVTPDKSIAFMMTKSKFKKRFYPQFFYPEFKELFNNKLIKEIKPENNDFLSDDFKQRRLIGENDDRFCELIRNDSVDEFIEYFKANNQRPLEIKPSVFESNIFLLKNNGTTIAEYAAFFGSTKIFQYITTVDIPMQNRLFKYAIHSQNLEMIHLIEKCNKISIQNDILKSCLFETVKCHHIELINYFKTNFNQNSINLREESMKHFNFIEMLNYKNIDNFNFYRFCQFGYLILVENYLKHNVNSIFTQDVFTIDFFLLKFLYLLLYSDVLFWAAIKGYVELVKFEIPRGKFKINDEFEIFIFIFFL